MIFIYKGGYETVKKSGVGIAIKHQEQALKSQNMPLATSWQEPFSIIHLNTVFPDSFFAALRAKIKKKKIVYYGHSTMEDFRNSFHGSNVFSPLFKFWISRCYTMGDIILTPSVYSKALLDTYNLKRPIYALSNGIDCAFFSYKDSYRQAFREKFHLAPDEKVVISVGHFIARKGITDFLDIAREMPEYTFIWFGETNLKLVPKEISRAIDNHPPNCHFPGFVSAEDLRNAYCGADCFLFLSREETEGIVVLEALACGIPTVLRDIPVYDAWIENGVAAFKSETVQEARVYTEDILSGRAPDLRESARKIAESRSIEAIGKALIEIYEKENLL